MCTINQSLGLKLLENSNSFIVILDENQSIFWINQPFCDFLGIERQKYLGLSADKINDPYLIQILKAKARVEMFSGILDKWIELYDVMSIDGNDVGAPGQKLTVHYYADVCQLVKTEKHLLQIETTLTYKMSHDSVTGMLSHHSMFQTLNAEVSRSRRYDNPLSIVLMNIDFKTCSDSSDREKIEQVRLMVSQLLKDQMRWADIVGHLDRFDFVLLLPETVLESAKILINKITEKIHDIGVDARHISYGTSQWQKGDDVNMFLGRAAEELI